MGRTKAAARMTCIHRRAARRESQLAEALGTERVKHRPRFQKAPDMLPVRIREHVVQGESKSMKRLPKRLVRDLEQAEGYTPGAIAIVGLFELGKPDGLVVLRLGDFCRLLGLRPPQGGQLALAARVA
jgi:hypothetical protein